MSNLAVLLLAAGACYNSGGGDNGFVRCALQPSECTGGGAGGSQIYRSTRWLNSNDPSVAATCATQASIHAIPAMGRCDGQADRFVCTSHSTACRFDISFRASDPECTVLHDYRATDSPFIHSYFGECVLKENNNNNSNNPGQGQGSYCAWQFNECSDEHIFETADEYYSQTQPSCQCDGVHTGACVSSLEDDDFFCAVTEDVCQQEEGMEYFKSYEVAQSLNAVCKLCDTTLPPPPTTRYAQAGACVVSAAAAAANSNSNSNNQFQFQHCALVPEHCSGPGETFVSPKALTDGGSSAASYPSEAQGCLTQQGIHQVRVGRCVSSVDQNVCVSDASACGLSTSFQYDDDCRLVQDLKTTGDHAAFSFTHFGHCTTREEDTFMGYDESLRPRENYCAWSFAECNTPNHNHDDDNNSNARPKSFFGSAVPGSATSMPTCQCDDVRTGACVSNTDPLDLYCAVAASACDPGYTYRNVVALEESSAAGGQPTLCYLCQDLPALLEAAPRPKPPVVGTPSRPTITTTTTTTKPTQSTPPSSVPLFEEELESNGLAVGAVVGIVLGVVLTAVIFGLAICMLRRGGTGDGDDDHDHYHGDDSGAAAVHVQGTSKQPSTHKKSDGHNNTSGVMMEEGQSETDFVAPTEKVV